MHSISDKELDFILNDIDSRGIVLEDLQENLLDHICCIIENEMREGEDFNRFYESVLPRFFKENLKEIQTETNNLLKFKNFYSMKKILKLSGILTVILTILGALMKSLHLPGTGITILLGGLIFCFIFLPLLIVIKFKDDDSKTDKLVFSFGLVLAIFMSVGLLFKIMHWPFGSNTIMWTTLVFTFVYVPVYYITRIKRPELKFNTLVNSVLMLACGGIFYSLFDLSPSYKYSQQMESNHVYMHENAEKLFTSNDRLYASEAINTDVKELHDLSKGINDQVEVMAEWIMGEKSSNGMKEFILELDRRVENYNHKVENLELNEMKSIQKDAYSEINNFNRELAMNVLARVQQQIAVNENCYLTSLLLKTNPS